MWRFPNEGGTPGHHPFEYGIFHDIPCKNNQLLGYQPFFHGTPSLYVLVVKHYENTSGSQLVRLRPQARHGLRQLAADEASSDDGQARWQDVQVEDGLVGEEGYLYDWLVV